MYLSVVTGYLIAAYLAGSKLKQSQASLINTFFVVSAFYFSWSTFINNMAVTIFQLQMERVPNFLDSSRVEWSSMDLVYTKKPRITGLIGLLWRFLEFAGLLFGSYGWT